MLIVQLRNATSQPSKTLQVFHLTLSFLSSELDIMNVFQQKQTSLYKPAMEFNQDMSDLKNHFNAIAITAAKETLLKSSMLGLPRPKPPLPGDSSEETQKRPNLPQRLWHDQITTRATVETVGLEDATASTLLPVSLSKPTQSAILAISTLNDQQEASSKFLNRMLSTTPTGEDKTDFYLTSTAAMPLETGVSKGNNLDIILATVDSSAAKTHTKGLLNGASPDVPTVSPEILKNSAITSNFRIPFEASTGEDVSESLQTTEEVNTAVSPTSPLDLPVTRNEPLTSKPFTPTSPPLIPGIHDGESFLWTTSATDEDFPSRMETPTAHIPAIHTTPVVTARDRRTKHLTTAGTAGNKELPEPRRLSTGQVDGKFHDVSGSGKIGTPVISGHDQDNVTAEQNAVNQTLVSTAKHTSATATSSVSGFPGFHASKRRPVCPYPPLPAHGTFYFHTIPNPAPFQYKHYIQYACYAGYTLANGDVYSYCLQDGRWSGVTPACIGKSYRTRV